MDYSFTYDEIFAAFDDCLRHKKNTIGAKEFCVDKVTNLLKLADEINSYTYEIGISKAFIITDPKIREVFAADFRDRIVHHLVIRELEPFFENYFIVGKDKGLAIGNLTSQMFANFYLTLFDYYCESLGLVIVRYADDFVVGHENLEYLKFCIPLLKAFAAEHLLLTIHPDKLYIQECSRGVTFTGAIIKQDRIYCGGRAICKMYDKIASRYSHYNEHQIDNFISSVNSYLGLMRHYKSYKVRKKFILSNIDEWMPHVTIGKSYQKINKVA